MVTSRLQLQVGVAAEPQRHACQLNYSFHCNVMLMCAFKIVCVSPCNRPWHFPSQSCAEIWSPIQRCQATVQADVCVAQEKCCHPKFGLCVCGSVCVYVTDVQDLTSATACRSLHKAFLFSLSRFPFFAVILVRLDVACIQPHWYSN